MSTTSEEYLEALCIRLLDHAVICGRISLISHMNSSPDFREIFKLANDLGLKSINLVKQLKQKKFLTDVIQDFWLKIHELKNRISTVSFFDNLVVSNFFKTVEDLKELLKLKNFG